MSVSRRDVVAGLACGPAAGAGLLQRLPGPPLLSAGLIVRDGRGRILRREMDGVVFGSGAAFGDGAPFRVASVSKMIATWAFLRLWKRHGLDVDGDTARWLGTSLRHPAHPDIAITPRMLMSHTSGLRNGADYPVRFGRTVAGRLDAAKIEADYGGWFAPPTERPGAYFAYCDLNTGVIAQLMERVSGVRFDLFMREKVFAPLSLDIGYNWSGVSQKKRDAAAPAARLFDGVWTVQVDGDVPRAPEIAVNRAEDAKDRSVDAYVLGENGMVFAPHGGLRLSLADMDRLARFFARGGGARGVLKEMATPAWTFDGANGATESGFWNRSGLGMQRFGTGPRDRYFGAQSDDWRGHFGDAYGWMTGLFWNVRDGRTLVYALNGMQEFDRPRAAATALTISEQAVIDLGLAA